VSSAATPCRWHYNTPTRIYQSSRRHIPRDLHQQHQSRNVRDSITNLRGRAQHSLKCTLPWWLHYELLSSLVDRGRYFRTQHKIDTSILLFHIILSILYRSRNSNLSKPTDTQFHRRQKIFDQSSIDQHLIKLCFYGNIRTSKILWTQ